MVNTPDLQMLIMYTAEQFEQNTLNYIRKYQMLQPNEIVTVGFSGGADSGALLFCLKRLHKQLGIEVRAVHINHRLRNQESDAEEEYVKKICNEQKIPLQIFYAKKEDERIPQSGLEVWAREKRYAIFEKIFDDTHGKIATAHTANDQAETVLFRLARGTSIKGAAAIPSIRGCYIRPLLWAEREDVEEYCRNVKYQYVTDSSNLTNQYARNKIRHTVLPVLKEVNSNAVHQIAEYCEEMSLVSEYVTLQADNLLKKAKNEYGWSCEILLKEHPVVINAAFAQLCSQKTEPNRQKVQLILQVAQGIILNASIAKGVRICNFQGTLLWEDQNDCAGIKQEIPIKEGLLYEKDGFGVKIWCESCETNKKITQFQKKVLTYCVDCDKIPNDTVLRQICPGDRIRPRGRGISKQLRKFYLEQKIPAPVRAKLPILASGSNVLWVWGYGFADGFDKDFGTKILKIQCNCDQQKENLK